MSNDDSNSPGSVLIGTSLASADAELNQVLVHVGAAESTGDAAVPGGAAACGQVGPTQETSIQDLPDEILGPLLASLFLVLTEKDDDDDGGDDNFDSNRFHGSSCSSGSNCGRSSSVRQVVIREHVNVYSSVSRNWCALLRASMRHVSLARLHGRADADAALATLRTYTGVTRVRIPERVAFSPGWGRLVRGLAGGGGPPALTRLELDMNLTTRALGHLSALLCHLSSLQALSLRLVDEGSSVVAIGGSLGIPLGMGVGGGVATGMGTGVGTGAGKSGGVAGEGEGKDVAVAVPMGDVENNAGGLATPAALELGGRDGSDDGIDDEDGNDAPMAAKWQRIYVALQSLDLSALVRLRSLAVNYEALCFLQCLPAGLCLPLSRHVAALPALQELRVEASLARPLPLWLAGVPAFVELRLCDTGHAPPSRHLVASLAATGAHLRQLALFLPHMRLGAPELDSLAASLPRLTSLNLRCNKVRDRASLGRLVFGSAAATSSSSSAAAAAAAPGAAAAGGVGLRSLSLESNMLPELQHPLPHLEQLRLRILGQDRFQADLFAHTPRLRALHVDLQDAATWPLLRHISASLASLSVRSFFLRREAGVDVANLAALRRLELRSCRQLAAVGGLLSLRAGSSGPRVTLHCHCQGSAILENHADYVAAQGACHHLTPGDARRLFHDTRGDEGETVPEGPLLP